MYVYTHTVYGEVREDEEQVRAEWRGLGTGQGQAGGQGKVSLHHSLWASCSLIGTWHCQPVRNPRAGWPQLRRMQNLESK